MQTANYLYDVLAVSHFDHYEKFQVIRDLTHQARVSCKSRDLRVRHHRSYRVVLNTDYSGPIGSFSVKSEYPARRPDVFVGSADDAPGLSLVQQLKGIITLNILLGSANPDLRESAGSCKGCYFASSLVN